MGSSADKAALARCLTFSLLSPELISLNRQRFYCLMSAALVRGHWLPSSLRHGEAEHSAGMNAVEQSSLCHRRQEAEGGD